MGRAHVAFGLVGAVCVVLGAAWAAWPVAQTDPDRGALVEFPWVLHGTALAIVGLGVAIWAMNAIRKERAEEFAPPPGWR